MNLRQAAARATATAFMFLAAASAHATTAIWNITWNDPTTGPKSASMNLFLFKTLTPDVYSIQSIGGTFDGATVSGPTGYQGADNLFYAQPPYPWAADGNGIGFKAGGVDYNIYYTYFFGSPNDYYNLPLTSSVTLLSDVPEPATWAMMMLGFGVAGGAMRYRRRNTRVAIAA